MGADNNEPPQRSLERAIMGHRHPARGVRPLPSWGNYSPPVTPCSPTLYRPGVAEQAARQASTTRRLPGPAARAGGLGRVPWSSRETPVSKYCFDRSTQSSKRANPTPLFAPSRRRRKKCSEQVGPHEPFPQQLPPGSRRSAPGTTVPSAGRRPARPAGGPRRDQRLSRQRRRVNLRPRAGPENEGVTTRRTRAERCCGRLH
jgi:hypothetical protein